MGCYKEIANLVNKPNQVSKRRTSLLANLFLQNNSVQAPLVYSGLDFNFLEFETSSNNFEFTPYIHTGLSLIRFDALHYPIGINEAQAYGKDNDLALPITVGIKIKPLNSFVVGLEISAKHSFTENLDGSYPEFDDSSLYSQRPFGSNLSQDWYVYSGITLTYLFGNYECDCTR